MVASPDQLTILARLVASGVGLPRMWYGPSGYFWVGEPPFWRAVSGRWGDPAGLIEYAYGAYPEGSVMVASDPQIAFGLAMRLDEWERSGGKKGLWASTLAQLMLPGRSGRPAFIRRMLARIEHIGMDHAIRRALRWRAGVGPLIEVMWHPARRQWLIKHESIPTHDHCWAFQADHLGSVPHTATCVPALAGITDPSEALRAIWAEVCGG